MKFLLVILFNGMLALNTHCQDTLTREYYLGKSKSQKTAGWILLGGGGTLAVVGTIILSNSNFLDVMEEDDSDVDTGGFMMLAGGAAVLTSIPFFISSSNNARKAALITINTQKVQVSRQDRIACRLQPAICLKINF